MSKNKYHDSDFRNIQEALDRLGQNIHIAPAPVQQAFIDLVQAVTRYRDALTDDGK